MGLCLALGACTTVTVVDRDGGVSVSRHFLTVALRVEDAGQSHTLASRGVGVFSSPVEVAIGAYRTEMAVLGGDCRAIFWPASVEQAEAIARLVDLNRICLAPKPSQRETRR